MYRVRGRSMSVIDEAERLRRRRVRRRIAIGVVSLVGVLAIWSNLGLIRQKSISLAKATLPFASAAPVKVQRAQRDPDEAEDGLSAIETRAGLTAKGVTSTEGGSSTRYAYRDVLCLARVVYHDGREFGPKARAAMAKVALNRLSTLDFGSNVCEVVYRGMGRQFGCMFRESCRAVGSVPNDTARWGEALTTAIGVLKGEIDTKAVGEATHFHRAGSKPSWSKRVTPVGEVDGLALAVEKRTLPTPPVIAGTSAAGAKVRPTAASSGPAQSSATVRRPTGSLDQSGRSGLGGPKPQGRNW